MEEYNKLLWDILFRHRGHKVEVATYGDPDNPDSVTLECTDCNCVLLDGGIYTICAREDI